MGRGRSRSACDWNFELTLSADRSVGNAIDFDFHFSREQHRLDRSPSRFVVAEELGVHLVHSLKIGGIGEEDGAFHHVRDTRATAFQNALNVF